MDALTRIRSNGKHLLGLINTVLDIAKIESGQFSLNLGEYAVESVVETVRVATESLAEAKKLSLKAETVRVLNNPELGEVAGGTTTAMTCTQSVVICENEHKTKHGHHCATYTCPPMTTYMTCPR